jgi:hypothetical protein
MYFDCQSHLYCMACQSVWLTINAILFWRMYLYYKMAPKFYYLHSMLGVSL